MSRYLKFTALVAVVASLTFCFGFYSALRKNVVFDSIVKTVRYLKPAVADASAPELRLDMSDRTLLDTTLLPFHRMDVTVTDEDGGVLPIVAVVADQRDEAVALGDDGSLLRVETESCVDSGCARNIGRLTRPDGTRIDDIYDMMRIEVDGRPEWYVSYGQLDRTGYSKSLVISRVDLSTDADSDALIRVEPPVFQARPFSLQNGHAKRAAGGAIAYDPRDDSIVVTVGDYSLNGIANDFPGDVPPPQSPDSDLGKVLRVDRKTGESRIISSGHRNPQGLSISATGEIISTEHAPKGGDEINLIRDGQNYGWPNVSMGTVYGTYEFPQKPLVEGTEHGGYTPPISAFLPSPGIGAIIHAEGFNKAWDGDLIAATLKARSLFRVRRWENGSYTEQVYIGDRIRDLDIAGGNLVLGTDGGKIIILSPVENVEMARTEIGLHTNLNALSNCGSCHNLNYPASTPGAPHLRNLLGRNIASASDYDGYSDALKSRGDEVWTEDRLEAFLRDPQSFASGTAMPDLDLSDADISELMTQIKLLR
ncbi:Glucose / Sorbosone dehydrogenase [Paracoccus isoporae]|uniref:Glucose / Sorbosone dehydrogenase n=1 Tax=Paracoccus isoporae TaxID=591205 RepID=A0A1G7GIJ3_9RHOB|nr:PQQ-dependent sugar dehydrogenase [Paracoccus isoporae]SDE87934.1 Glucose / Sorbosone dehydrogenase [Paracoccus isoporae]